MPTPSGTNPLRHSIRTFIAQALLNRLKKQGEKAFSAFVIADELEENDFPEAATWLRQRYQQLLPKEEPPLPQ